MDTGHQSAVLAFDQAHAEFVAELKKTPPAALRYRPAGEDYALGGLGVHVALVLEKYARALEAMRAAGQRSVAEPPPPAFSEADDALVRDGLDAHTLATVLERVDAAHRGVVTAIQAVPKDSFRVAAAVTFAGSAEPFPTSPADVLGWVHDHYVEHIRQIADLRSAWASTQT